MQWLNAETNTVVDITPGHVLTSDARVIRLRSCARTACSIWHGNPMYCSKSCANRVNLARRWAEKDADRKTRANGGQLGKQELRDIIRNVKQELATIRDAITRNK